MKYAIVRFQPTLSLVQCTSLPTVTKERQFVHLEEIRKKPLEIKKPEV